jgi:4-amino-4-deoxy-L-arabinose transferase-like glycosyltransferase
VQLRLALATLIGLCLGLCMVFYYWTAGAEQFTTTGSPSYYNLLTDAVLHGQTSLLVKPKAQLLALPDPYDPRWNSPYRLHDALLYKGKYYLYWGLSPVLLAYLPVRILTGDYLTDATACVVFASLGLLLYAFLIVGVREDHFPDASRWTTILLILLTAFATMIPFVLRRHLVYEVAITCGYFLTAAFFLAIYRGAFRGALKPGWLFASGTALGLVFLCRPNLTICILTAVVVCFLYARRSSRPGISLHQLLGLAFGPLLVCIAAQAYYNFVRFGSPADFGLRYQVNMDYMPGYTFFSVARGLSSALYYLFSLPIFSPRFPFLTATPDGLIGPFRQVAQALQPYVPDFHVEQLVGFPVAVPLILVLVIAPFLRLRALRRDLSWFLLSLLAAAIVQIAFICVALGPTTRYEVDFMPLLLLALAIIVLCIDRRAKPRWATWSLRTSLAVLVLYTVCISATMSFTNGVAWVR